MQVKGVMIDCSRVLERHAYYYRLIDFISQWGLNTLVLHFSDDHGLSVRVPGFAPLARERAFTPAQLRKLIAHARKRGVDVIPEVETFGHTRYLTGRKPYRHLFVGEQSRSINFNAIDPLHPDTHALMRKLIRATAKLFPSKYLHIGCDEVNLRGYCKQLNGSKLADVWVGYVNQMIDLTREAGKTALIWADHLECDVTIARRINKAAIPISWNYDPDARDAGIKSLKRAGFKRVWVAPSTHSHLFRFLPSEVGMDNADRMARFAHRHRAQGYLNTLWEPYFGLQAAAYYGIAYAAETCRAGGDMDRVAFNRKFVRRVFGTAMTKPLKRFLESFPKLHLDIKACEWIVGDADSMSRQLWAQLRRVNTIGREILPLAEQYTPHDNEDIWRGIVIAAQAAWVCSEYALLHRWGGSAQRRGAYNRALNRARRDVSAEWDRTRFADDPDKRRPFYANRRFSYALLVLKDLERL